MRPLIGISVDCRHDPDDVRSRGRLQLNWNYAQAVSDAGGVPLLIPPTADADVIAELIDGWLIPGGDDIDAANFGEENHAKVSLQDPHRYAAEQSLYAAITPSLPIFGICYGCQFLNVAQGGTLQQHVPDFVGHEEHGSGELQTYAVAPGSKLAGILETDSVQGKSYHHQAVGQLGREIEVVSRHADGTVEAIEATDRPWVIGVQWHPERTLDDPATQRLFTNFIHAATEYRKARGRA